MSEHRVAEELAAVAVVVIGGGPAGLAAALWVAGYRRRVLLVDGGRPRNAPTVATHGYLGTDGEIKLLDPPHEWPCRSDDDGFEVVLDDGRTVRALRLILATGVVDVLPSIDRFGEFSGSCAFTCPTCDGYEAQRKTIVVIGDHGDLGAFAVGMLDWASAVTLIVEPTSADAPAAELDMVNDAGIDVVIGTPAALLGEAGTLQGVRLTDGSIIPCDMLFFAGDQIQHSNVADRLGCEISDEGCVVVDEDGRTSVPNVFAAGDMTPGPHLVQVAAAKGTRAGIAAALSFRGESGVPGSPRPAPDPSSVRSG